MRLYRELSTGGQPGKGLVATQPNGVRAATDQASTWFHVQRGAGLVAVGAVCWLAHSVLMLTGFFDVVGAIFGGPCGAPQAGPVGGAPAQAVYLGAIAAVRIAAFLLAFGMFSYRGGTTAVMRTGPAGADHRISERTRSKAVTTGIAFLIYGALGIVASIAWLSLSTGAAGVTGDAARTSLAVLSFAWIVASVFLVIAAGMFTEFVRGVGFETRSPTSFGIEGLVAYSSINLLGVLLVTIPILLLLGGATGVPGMTFIIGIVLEFIAIPIFGIVLFSRMTWGALRLPSLLTGR